MNNDWYNEYATIRDWYKLNDTYKEGHTPAIKISIRDAIKANELDYGIFWTVNDFLHKERKKVNLHRVLAFGIDLDGNDKEAQRSVINNGPTPSLVVETRSGYHVYYNLLPNDLNADQYREFVRDHFEAQLGADPNAKDACRILRVPNFKHWKDPSNPFEITLAFISDNKYTVKQLKEYYPISEKRKKEKELIKHMQSEIPEITSEQVDSIFHMNQMEALRRLSGHEAVNRETFSFKPVANGNYNIYVNGKSTSTFIDKNFKIGSSSGGGPTIYQWVNYYTKNPKTTMQVLKQVFQEKFTNE